jgi:hypothetical protein
MAKSLNAGDLRGGVELATAIALPKISAKLELIFAVQFFLVWVFTQLGLQFRGKALRIHVLCYHLLKFLI